MVERNSDISLDLRHVVVMLGSFPALSGLDLECRAGEIVLVQGPNGAGKTTLLKVCAGLLAIRSGTATVLGFDLRDRRRDVRRDVRRRVGLLGHVGFLYDDLTVEDNVRFAVRANGGDPSEVGAVLARLGLDGRVARLPVAACSAGQRRRTSLALVVARRPKLWLLDEPHANLDRETRNLLDSIVRDAASAGATVLVASHDDDRGGALATRFVTVAGGHVIDDVAAHSATVPDAAVELAAVHGS